MFIYAIAFRVGKFINEHIQRVELSLTATTSSADDETRVPWMIAATNGDNCSSSSSDESVEEFDLTESGEEVQGNFVFAEVRPGAVSAAVKAAA